MKHINNATRPTRQQKRLIEKAGLNPWDWLVASETDKLRIVKDGKAREIEGGGNKKRR